jgi:hypothetical protein
MLSRKSDLHRLLQGFAVVGDNERHQFEDLYQEVCVSEHGKRALFTKAVMRSRGHRQANLPSQLASTSTVDAAQRPLVTVLGDAHELVGVSFDDFLTVLGTGVVKTTNSQKRHGRRRAMGDR